MRPEIIVEFRLDPYLPSRFLAIPIDDLIIREMSAPIDFPSVAALTSPSIGDWMTVNHICTSPDEIAKRLKKREDVTALLSSHIASVIHQHLARRDTEMGYPKQGPTGDAGGS